MSKQPRAPLGRAAVLAAITGASVAALGSGLSEPPSVAALAVPAATALTVPTDPALAVPVAAATTVPGVATLAPGPPPQSPVAPTRAASTPAAPPVVAARTIPQGPWFGVLDADGGHAAAERRAGVTVVSIELQWRAYQPARGSVDRDYISRMRSRLQALRSAGLAVILDAGLQYAPDWVFALDAGTRFVDQYGDVWHGGFSEDAPNGVYDPRVRQAESDYIARIAADFGDSFYAVRTGGLLQDELRYPDPSYNGHRNCFWAFDANAMAASPVPGWKPGDADIGKARAFMDHYLAALTDYETFLLGTYRSHFSGWLQLILPSWGLRPGDVETAVSRNLDGSTPAASWGSLQTGLDWARQVSAIRDPHVQLYTTWMERGDDGGTATTLGPGHYLVSLGRPRGFPVVGENADPGADMASVVRRARAWGLAGMLWLDERALVDSGALPAYAALIG